MKHPELIKTSVIANAGNHRFLNIDDLLDHLGPVEHLNHLRDRR
jgi:hypothetical protein